MFTLALQLPCKSNAVVEAGKIVSPQLLAFLVELR